VEKWPEAPGQFDGYRSDVRPEVVVERVEVRVGERQEGDVVILL
jgi:hypothetical protein